jgi:NADH:ubiquinone oxidoreductase subunit 2 (subunit N)
MSSAVLWIFLPAGVAVGLLFYRRKDSLPLVISTIMSSFLAWMAWQVPIDEVLTLGPFSFEIAPNLVLFGRNFTLADAQRPLLSYVFLSESFWLMGGLIAQPRRLFIPLSLLSVALFVAALSVDPFLYASLIIALVVLISIPLLAPSGTSPGPGLLRYLVFQLFSIPFILFTGWLLTGVEASPGNFNLVLRAGVLLALGFVFLMAIFPFHSWMPMLSKETHPYPFAFFAVLLSSFGGLFILGFLERYAWLRENAMVFQLLVFSGTLTLVLASLWAVTTQNLGGIFAFVNMAGLGVGLQTLGLGGGEGTQLFFALLFPRLLAFWMMAVVISQVLRMASGLDLNGISSTLRSNPIFFGGLVIALLSLAGIPVLGGFPGQVSLWAALAEISPVLLFLSLLSNAALAGVGYRIVQVVLLAEPRGRVEPKIDEATEETVEYTDIQDPSSWAFLGLSVIALLGFGLFSRLFLASIPALASMFPQLFP